MTSYYQSLRNRAKKPIHFLKSPILTGNYRSGNFREAAWLIGDGRSGTTWVADLLRKSLSYRIVYEPFHPDCIAEKPSLPLNSYLRPGDTAPLSEVIVESVFSGKFSHERTDGRNLSLVYKGLLVKDIFANLFACWVANQFPDLKIILLIRNPFAVALSKYKKRDWLWMTNPIDFLQQSTLFDDYLRPYEDLILGVGDDYIERQVMIWAIIHYVPLLQFKHERIHVVFFEDIYTNPKQEFSSLFEYLRPGSGYTDLSIPEKVFKRPSKVSGKESNIVMGNSPVDSWINELSSKQIESGFKILERFGLDKMYHENGLPYQRLAGFL